MQPSNDSSGDEIRVILFISQTTGKIDDRTNSYCGVGLRGELTSNILIKEQSIKYKFVREFLDSNHDLEIAIAKYKPSVIIYNYHSITTQWMNDRNIRNRYTNIKHIMIHYDLQQSHIDTFNPEKFNGFNYVITDNETLNVDDTNVFKVTRSLPYTDIVADELRKDNIPIIGFQGFGLPHKGIIHIANQIQAEFDEAIFRLHMPFSYYVDRHGTQARERIREIQNIIKKPGIKVEVSHNFLSDQEIVQWLHSNTINCYFIDTMPGSGIASSPDYAIAARRPIAVNSSNMLKNLHNLEPSIEIEKNSLKQIIANGITPLLPIYNKYKQENVLRDYEHICDILLSIVSGTHV